MAAYYNEIDPFAAEWLRQLIKQGMIADGVVDERSIEDVVPSELSEFTQCHFFAGIGTWSYALRQAGWADGRPVWTGSCPCQPFSEAGQRKGTADERHLWPVFYHLIRQCRPRVIFGEQVASKDGLTWWDIVQASLEEAHYFSAAFDLCAASFGAPHIRQRLYWVAYTNSEGQLLREARGTQVQVQQTQTGNPTNGFWKDCEWLPCTDGKLRCTQPGILPLAHGTPSRVASLRGYGNAIVAPQAQAFIEAYMETLIDEGADIIERTRPNFGKGD